MQRGFPNMPVNYQVFPLTWRGSVSLYAVEIARNYFGHTKLVLCGCPMTIEGGHFQRKKPWGTAIRFRKGWDGPKEELRSCLRSVSGWTQVEFGLPSKQWLNT